MTSPNTLVTPGSFYVSQDSDVNPTILELEDSISIGIFHGKNNAIRGLAHLLYDDIQQHETFISSYLTHFNNFDQRTRGIKGAIICNGPTFSDNLDHLKQTLYNSGIEHIYHNTATLSSLKPIHHKHIIMFPHIARIVYCGIPRQHAPTPILSCTDYPYTRQK